MHLVLFSVRPIAVISVLLGCAVAAHAQGTREDYARAERFLPTEASRFAFTGQVEPHWVGKTSRFWYRKEGPGGKEFLLVDARQATKGPAFDHEKLASSLSRATRQSYAARALPFDAITFVGNADAIQVAIAGTSWTCTLASYECQPGPPAAGEPVPGRLPDPNSTSPDRRFVAHVRDHNLWVRVAATGEDIQLSHDGEPGYDYATPLPSAALMVQQGTEDVHQAPRVFWSPDSTKIATYVMDQRNFPRLTIVQSAPPDQFRPKTFNYAYPLPIDFVLPTAKLVIFDVAQRRQIPVWARPLTMLYYGGPTLQWTDDGRRFTYLEIERGYEHVRLRDVDARTGVSRTIIEETGDPLVATSISVMRIFSGGREVIWSAERDGWNHFYLYDAVTGTLKNRITAGEWVIRTLDHVDEQMRVLYFTGAGHEPGEDPYLRHLYRVNVHRPGRAHGGPGRTAQPRRADLDVPARFHRQHQV